MCRYSGGVLSLPIIQLFQIDLFSILLSPLNTPHTPIKRNKSPYVIPSRHFGSKIANEAELIDTHTHTHTHTHTQDSIERDFDRKKPPPGRVFYVLCSLSKSRV